LFASELRAGGFEVAAVKMLHQLDYIAADITVATVEDVLLRVDAKAINKTALRARADHFSADPLEPEAAPRDLVFDRHGACAINPSVGVDGVDSGAHAASAAVGRRGIRAT
jgi:hypothetical protein